MISRLVHSSRATNYIGLSEVGARIWELIDTPQQIDAVCAQLQVEYDVAPEICRFEVESFLNELVHHGAVALDPPPAASVRAGRQSSTRAGGRGGCLPAAGPSRLAFHSFPQACARLGTFVPPSDPRALAARTAAAREQAGIAEEIGWAVTRSARYVPFRAVCSPQAMAAQFMLRRRHVASVMHFGAARGQEKPLDAHAWLDAAGVEVTGYPVGENFTEIACFV